MQTFCRFWDRCHPSLHRHCYRNTMAASLGPCFFRQSISHHGLERDRWSICAVSPSCVVLEAISPFFTAFFTFKGIYPIGLTSWLFVLCGVISTQSPIISYQIICTFTLLSNAVSLVQRLIVVVQKEKPLCRMWREWQAVFSYMKWASARTFRKLFCLDALSFI